MVKQRGFEEVTEAKKKHGKKVSMHGKEISFFPDTILPVRADAGSAGYDFATPVEVSVLPGKQEVIWTNVKAYMKEDEVLQLFVRSSLGIKKGLVLANGTGIIDASYYENESNDGNIGICVRNTTGTTVVLGQGERIAQGVFTKFLTADEDVTLNNKRVGGIGSSGE